MNKLFDICSCKCSDMSNCKCSEKRKVPENVRHFLLDQRDERKLRISSKMFHKNVMEQNNYNQASQSSSGPDSLEIEQKESQEFSISKLREKKGSVKLSETVITGQRFGVSDRAIEAIASSTLADHGLLKEGDNNLVVDRNKVRRSKRKVNDEIQNCPDDTVIRAVYFDGRKDDTIVQIKRGSKFRRVSIKEEHISVISKPESIYVGHVVPESSGAKNVASSILNLISNKGGYAELIVVGCDGTVVNTGYKGGVIRQIEKEIGRPVQWSICLLHFNELPFRALFLHIDGKTEGPNSFTGHIGKKLKSCETLPIVQFEKIDFPVPDIDTADLSADQKYLLEISKAIKTGECSTDLSFNQPGCLNHARWLTCANRILRLYISTTNPSAELKIIVTFLLKVYVPQWFSIRRNKSIAQGSRHLFETIRLTRYLPPVYLEVINKAIQRNAFFAMPENIVLSMMTDVDLNTRKLALEKILSAREEAYNGNMQALTSKLPVINFAATIYHEMIDWSTTPYKSPPILNNVSNEELIKQLTSETVFKEWEFYKYPCHTVAVERLVKLVTEASSKVCGMENRNGMIAATLLSRKSFQRFDTKK